MGMTVPLLSSDMAGSSGVFCSTFLRRAPTLFLAFSEYVRCDNYQSLLAFSEYVRCDNYQSLLAFSECVRCDNYQSPRRVAACPPETWTVSAPTSASRPWMGRLALKLSSSSVVPFKFLIRPLACALNRTGAP